MYMYWRSTLWIKEETRLHASISILYSICVQTLRAHKQTYNTLFTCLLECGVGVGWGWRWRGGGGITCMSGCTLVCGEAWISCVWKVKYRLLETIHIMNKKVYYYSICMWETFREYTGMWGSIYFMR